MRELLRRTDMRVYLVGQGLSLFGSMSLWLAAGIWVKTLTGSYGAAGMAFFCTTLGTLAGPLTGMLVDRLRRRPLLIITNLAAAALLLPLLAVRGAAQLWLIYLVLLGYGALHGLIASGQSALMVEMLPTRLLPHANGALRAVQESLRLISPLAGAGLFAWQGFSAVVLLDIAGFLAVAVSLLLIRHHAPAPLRVTERLRDAASAGLRHIAATRTLRGFTIATVVATAVLGFGESALFAVAEEGLDRATTFVGVLITAQGVGAVLTAPFSGVLVGRLGEIRLAAAGVALFAACCALLTTPYLLAVLAGAALAGVGLPWMFVGATTLLQRRTPDHLQGRVYSGFELAVTVPQTLSIAVGAALIGVLGYQALLLASAVVMGLAAVLMLRVHHREGTASGAADDLAVEHGEPAVLGGDPGEPAVADPR